MAEIIILDQIPEIEEFYKNYWGKQSFLVRGAIPIPLFDELIDGDNLAGLALDEEVRSRIVTTQPDNKWSCEHGPFEEEKFANLGDENWSLLVQNVDSFYPDTAQLLEYFNFSPRWLMDDIMVSYSAVRGGVGAHMDSYHVFLVQGKGKRSWKVSNETLQGKEFIDNADLQIFKDGFEGAEVEVSIGDVIYIPPYFGHQGVTIEEAMTFSVGFLGPKISEILSEYCYYLEEHPELNKRYTGQGLDKKSAGFTIAADASSLIQNTLVGAIKDEGFSSWLSEYFLNPNKD